MTPPARRRRPAPRPAPPPVAALKREALEDLLELHSRSPVTPLCRECMTAHPCRTLELARIVAGETTPEQETSA